MANPFSVSPNPLIRRGLEAAMTPFNRGNGNSPTAIGPNLPGMTPMTMPGTSTPGQFQSDNRGGMPSSAYGSDNPFSLQSPGAFENAFSSYLGPKLTTPYAAEGMLGDVFQNLQGPGAAQNFWDQNQNTFADNMGAGNPLNAALSSFQSNRPDLANDPGLSPFYENAKRRAMESIDAQAASRGAYGSSAALDQGTEAFTNLEAERANREADYNLQRAAENRAWETLGGNLSSNLASSQLGWGNLGAGAAGQAGSETLGRQSAAGNVANAQGNLEMNRDATFMTAAQIAQAMREGRLGDMFNRVAGMGDRGANIFLGATGQAGGQDAATFDASMGAGQAAGQAGVNTKAVENQLPWQAIGNVADTAATVAPMFAGMPPLPMVGPAPQGAGRSGALSIQDFDY